jgi:hypothetical protein
MLLSPVVAQVAPLARLGLVVVVVPAVIGLVFLASPLGVALPQNPLWL